MNSDILMLAAVLRELGQQVWQSNIAHSLKQFVDAVTAIFAMALSTAITTGALATMAALAMDLALRLTGGQSSRRGEIVARALEFAAACLVLALGGLCCWGSRWRGFRRDWRARHPHPISRTALNRKSADETS